MKILFLILSFLILPITIKAQALQNQASDIMIKSIEQEFLPIFCKQGDRGVKIAVHQCYTHQAVINDTKEKCIIADYAFYDLIQYHKKRNEILGEPDSDDIDFFHIENVNKRLINFKNSTLPFKNYTNQEFKNYLSNTSAIIKSTYLNLYEETNKNCITNYQP